jgi:hypothetical protein
MIVYDLQCSKGHRFEGWFETLADYEKQESTGLIACPICDTAEVSRVPSTFSLRSAPAPPPVKVNAGKTVSPEEIKTKVRDFLEKNFDDVGCDFTREALKIHYGVTEPRNIRGVSTKEEEKTLEKEGIRFFKIPVPIPSDPDS